MAIDAYWGRHHLGESWRFSQARLIGKLSSFVAAGGLFAAAVGVGFIPYFEQAIRCAHPRSWV
jgi:hypothetical protein